ncbi:MAG: hypothetical protein Q4C18_02620 [Eubacteriales bacterium]|nr:hypothetical protein [Eubacteriales bacterium]
MKNKELIFPLLILALSPFVWYSNQPGIDGMKGVNFLISPVCLLSVVLVIGGSVTMRRRWMFLVGNLLFISSVFLYVYNQGKMFEGNSYSLMEMASGLQPSGIAVIGVAVGGSLLGIVQMMREHSN